jgi:hypothetical protein
MAPSSAIPRDREKIKYEHLPTTYEIINTLENLTANIHYCYLLDNIIFSVAKQMYGSVMSWPPGSRSVIQDYKSPGPDQKKIFTDPQHCNPCRIIYCFSPSSSRDLDEAMEFESQNSAKVIFVLFFITCLSMF